LVIQVTVWPVLFLDQILRCQLWRLQNCHWRGAVDCWSIEY